MRSEPRNDSAQQRARARRVVDHWPAVEEAALDAVRALRAAQGKMARRGGVDARALERCAAALLRALDGANGAPAWVQCKGCGETVRTLEAHRRGACAGRGRAMKAYRFGDDDAREVAEVEGPGPMSAAEWRSLVAACEPWDDRGGAMDEALEAAHREAIDEELARLGEVTEGAPERRLLTIDLEELDATAGELAGLGDVDWGDL